MLFLANPSIQVRLPAPFDFFFATLTPFWPVNSPSHHGRPNDAIASVDCPLHIVERGRVANHAADPTQTFRHQGKHPERLVGHGKRRLDAMRGSRGEAEAGVEVGMADNNHDGMPQPVTRFESFAYQIGADTLTLEVRKYCHRSERQSPCRGVIRFDLDWTEEDVPNHRVGADSHKGKSRGETLRVPDRGHQPCLVLLSEPKPVDALDGSAVVGTLWTDDGCHRSFIFVSLTSLLLRVVPIVGVDHVRDQHSVDGHTRQIATDDLDVS